ncbi:MAG: hypothetical protein JSU65_10250 [Candidatus Zixiibacteriota bacterium]|nr:MAG: hypothetical protein JSU65_10250 [candidate division Zixibacteria bacterium]
MNKHVKLLAALYLLWGAMGLLALLFLLILTVFGAGLAATDNVRAGMILGILGSIVVLITTVVSLPNIIAGMGLLKYAQWGRILALILSFLNLFSFPIGTALGGYGIWVLFQPETIAMFQERGR